MRHSLPALPAAAAAAAVARPTEQMPQTIHSPPPPPPLTCTAPQSINEPQSLDLYKIDEPLQPSSEEYLGCFADTADDRIFGDEIKNRDDMTQAVCRAHCEGFGSRFYATQVPASLSCLCCPAPAPLLVLWSRPVVPPAMLAWLSRLLSRRAVRSL